MNAVSEKTNLAKIELAPKAAAAFSLVPQSLTEAMELAKLIADSDLAPKDYRGKPGNVLIAVQMGQEVGLSPMSAIQSIAVINGKPGLYGDVGKALLLMKGLIIEEDDVAIVKKTGMGRCRITRPGHPPCERTFSIENAKTAGLWGKQGPWSQYPERQMAWRAFWFAARDIASDLLKGLSGAEEAIDIPPMNAPIEHGPQPYPQDAFDKNLPTWRELITSGKKRADQIIATVESKGTLTEAQKDAIRALKKSAPEKTTTTTGTDAGAGKTGNGGAPTVTYAIVKDKLDKATSLDLLDAHADLIGEVADAVQRTELGAHYKQRREELAPK